MVAPAMPMPSTINLNAMPIGSGSFSGGASKRPRKLRADTQGDARIMFDRMRAREDETNHVFMEGLISVGGGDDIPFEPDETQSHDGRTPFMAGHDGIGYPFGEDMAAPLMAYQLGLGNSFPLDHEFSEDYGLNEEDDEMGIDG
ncbi:hypothetical protein D1007_42355 [Hordeum vulgare]|nr:hypothetical protein D1007_42355 [Hordeum vulgare]